MEYQIIDEPRQNNLSKLVVNPIVIILFAMVLPFVFSLSSYARYGLPLIWAILNGFWMGSPLRWKTTSIGVLGYILIILLPYIAAFTVIAIGLKEQIDTFFPYIRIANQALFFFVLFWLISIQQSSYEIYEYLKSLRD